MLFRSPQNRGARIRHAGRLHFAREPDIAIVVANHAIARDRQASAEIHGPRDELGTQAHDQKDRPLVRRAELLDLEFERAAAALDRNLHGPDFKGYAAVSLDGILARARQSEGDCPVQRRKARVKQLPAENPSR